ncbi:MAG: hypothetical protein ABSA54_04205 [Terriglobales bacterium]
MSTAKRKIDADHPILASIKGVTQHEGVEHEYEQVGFGMVSEGYTEIAVPVTLAMDEIPNLVGDHLWSKVFGIADEIAKQQMKMLFKTIEEATEKAGTRIDNKGRPITADSLLQMMEMTEVEFDRKGNPTSVFVIHPDMQETARKISEQIENDPELKARGEAIRRKHYESWLARENNRKLVD